MNQFNFQKQKLTQRIPNCYDLDARCESIYNVTLKANGTLNNTRQKQNNVQRQKDKISEKRPNIHHIIAYYKPWLARYTKTAKLLWCFSTPTSPHSLNFFFILFW